MGKPRCDNPENLSLAELKLDRIFLRFFFFFARMRYIAECDGLAEKNGKATDYKMVQDGFLCFVFLMNGISTPRARFFFLTPNTHCYDIHFINLTTY